MDADPGGSGALLIERIPLGVDVERRPGITRWQTHVLHIAGLRPPEPGLSEWALIAEDGPVQRFFAGNAELLLHSTDTQVYRDNLESPTPAVYVVLRRGAGPFGWRLYLVTADPTEAHAHVDVGDDLVGALPMPPPVFARASEFVARHHVERRKWKRSRDRADPDALGPRPGGRRGGQDA